jgi:hypothetical protein
MAKFVKGNQFWKLRSEHGRDKLFASPELLWEAATEYFNWVDSHPWYKVEAVKSGDLAGTLMKIPMVRPYTLSGFQLYIGSSESYWRDFKKANHADFSSVIAEIENAMTTQKFEGAAVGAFNANIISRDLGLRDNLGISDPHGKPLAAAPSMIIVQPGDTSGFEIKESEG